MSRTWTRDSYLISTDPSLIPISDLNAVFATDLVYWATPLPENVMRETIDNSLCFVLFDTKAPANANYDANGQRATDSKLIGFARCVTDFTTFSYLTDVYVLLAYQGEGLGRWLVACVGEVHDSMPHLRRSMLFTGDWKRSVPFYQSVLGMDTLNAGSEGSGGPAIMQKRGPGFPASLYHNQEEDSEANGDLESEK
ncbi:hypothetical protein N0V91_002006 [Didymella pomorum]|uniref:N-acetyltransferase domain-containing protein n=1 Tax=Didymella pomorum TaxID=749634 RepID=A0A9W8ZL97_9PLEO|nr:hypothetical protein N0V91_002006 [Didymella pomorum]